MIPRETDSPSPSPAPGSKRFDAPALDLSRRRSAAASRRRILLQTSCHPAQGASRRGVSECRRAECSTPFGLTDGERRMFWCEKPDFSGISKSATVESRMGAVAWGLRPTPRFPSPLIKPDEPISGIRLSDWLHRKAHGDKLTVRGFGTVRNSPSPLDTAISGGACH